jgi:hypothetical protein
MFEEHAGNKSVIDLIELIILIVIVQVEDTSAEAVVCAGRRTESQSKSTGNINATDITSWNNTIYKRPATSNLDVTKRAFTGELGFVNSLGITDCYRIQVIEPASSAARSRVIYVVVG